MNVLLFGAVHHDMWHYESILESKDISAIVPAERFRSEAAVPREWYDKNTRSCDALVAPIVQITCTEDTSVRNRFEPSSAVCRRRNTGVTR
jgi:hypothetical protein